jgi:hypothetical protein
MNPRHREIVESFDNLPVDAIVPDRVTRFLFGDPSEWTFRRHPPVPRLQISPGRKGSRVGDIRERIRAMRAIA